MAWTVVKEKIVRVTGLGLLLPHLAAFLYALWNVMLHMGAFVSNGMEDMLFFAAYLSLFFSMCASAAYIGAILRNRYVGLAMLGVCQAAICGGALVHMGLQTLGMGIMLLHAPSIYVLQQMLRWQFIARLRRKLAAAAAAKQAGAAGK